MSMSTMGPHWYGYSMVPEENKREETERAKQGDVARRRE
jgi:hypothetical protein